jgi:hypothetical protein
MELVIEGVSKCYKGGVCGLKNFSLSLLLGLQRIECWAPMPGHTLIEPCEG